MSGFTKELFVLDVPVDLTCILCLEVLNDPHKCKNHDHLFCNMCIRKSLRKCKKECPLCKETLYLKTLKQDFTTRLIIEALQVKCNKTTLDDSVCEWNGLSSHWKNHVCEHSLIGRNVTKYFPGHGTFVGIIVALDK
jgi:hypothetical protein